MTQDPTRSLAGIDLLSEIDKDELSLIEARCGWRHFNPQEQIIDRHSVSKDVYFIIQGTVRVVNYSVSGREIYFDDINAGAIFGEFSAIDGEPRSANVVAVTHTIVASMSPNVFQEMLADHPNVAFILMKRLAGIIRTSVERIMDLSTLGANNRVYAELLRLAKLNMNNDMTATISPVPNHSDVASRVSTTRETVARVFGELTKNKILKKLDNKLEVNDVERLRKMVELFRGD